jgi:penicillin amidase
VIRVVKLNQKEIEIAAHHGTVFLRRDENGVPHIRAGSYQDLLFGLGWAHAYDRLVGMDLTRVIGKGAASEQLDGSAEFVEIDRFMRRYRLWADSQEEARKLKGETRELVDAYCRGANRGMEVRRPFEFRLIRHRPEPWTPADCILIVRMMGLVDLSETQGFMEKFIVQMIQNGVPLAHIRELCPYMTDEPDREYMDVIKNVKLAQPIVPPTIGWSAVPRLESSNNWVVSGERTASGKPILCGDPHLDTARLPAIWYEVAMRCDDFYFLGATVPGLPACALGRTEDLAWAPTYGCMDVSDYFIEEVKGGKYRRGDDWQDFIVREETLDVKGKEPVKLHYYETAHGVLDTEPAGDGYYLSYALSSERTGARDAENMMKLPLLKTVSEAMGYFATLDFGAFNWVLADGAGNIGYQMSGGVPVRPQGVSGLLPLPGWDERFDWKGLHDREKNPRLYNPDEGYFGTANQDVNYLAGVQMLTLPMADNRARRIAQMLAARKDHTADTMEKMHYDLYANQAEEFMKVIGPLLPDTPNGRLLAGWDFVYDPDSPAPMLFESVYRELRRTVFGDCGMGSEVVDCLLDETIIPYIFYGNFDRILLSEDSAWFGGKPRDELFRTAIEKGLDVEAVRYGGTRKVVMKNLFFGGRLPRFLGFDYGPIELPGSRSTITQGQLFTSGGRLATFSPTYKFIADFAEDHIHSVLAGGPSDRRFSKWYTSGIKDWLAGRYKSLAP